MSPELAFLMVRILAATILYSFFGLLIYWLIRDSRLGVHAQAPAPQAHLVVLETDAQILLRQNSELGRTAGNVVQIEDETISARHARLMFQNGQWWVEDLASRNGTMVNGIPVEEPMVVSYGDEIQLGRVVTRLEAGAILAPNSEASTVSHQDG